MLVVYYLCKSFNASEEEGHPSFELVAHTDLCVCTSFQVGLEESQKAHHHLLNFVHPHPPNTIPGSPTGKRGFTQQLQGA